MNNEQFLDMLNLIEELRTLSFSVDASAKNLNEQKTRLVEATLAMQEVSGLKTVYQEKSRALSEKIDEMKTLMDL